MTPAQLQNRDLFVLAYHHYLDARAAADAKQTRKALAEREAAREAVVAALPGLSGVAPSRQPLTNLLAELGGEPHAHRHSCAMPLELSSERLSRSRSALAAHLVELQAAVAELDQ